MNVYCQRVTEKFWEREKELEDLRQSYLNLQAKFVQLELVFKTNLQAQKKREEQLHLLKLENQGLRKIEKESLQKRAELEDKLTNIANERNRWKRAFLEQKNFFELRDTTYRKEHERTVESTRKEYEELLKTTRETTENYVNELVNLYESTRDKAEMLQGQVNVLRERWKVTEARAFEMANLLETLERFNVSVPSICRRVAEALKNLGERDGAFGEKMKALRQLTWEVKDKTDSQEEEAIRAQNLALREIVKKLKRELQAANLSEDCKNKRPEKEKKHCESLTSNRNENLKYSNESTSHNSAASNPEKYANTESNGESTVTIDFKKSEMLPELQKIDNSKNLYSQNERRICEVNSKIRGAQKNTFCENEFTVNRERVHSENSKVFSIDTVTSHLNGIPFEECVIRFLKNQEIKVKHCTALTDSDEYPVKLEFVDNEEYYQDAPVDRILVLVKNFERITRIGPNGVNCGIQTTKVRVTNDFTQTSLTALDHFSRVNVKATMLNSEKRAIERTLCNLERTVDDLRSNALGQAQSMIGKNSKFIGNNEFFKCIRLLDR